jgi:ABC-2 type transport system ATP-binding protein
MRRGRLVAVKTIEEIRGEREQRLEIVFRDGAAPNAPPQELKDFAIAQIEPGRWQARFSGSPDPLLKWLTRFEVLEISSPAVSLEEAFLAYYRDDLSDARDGERRSEEAS